MPVRRSEMEVTCSTSACVGREGSSEAKETGHMGPAQSGIRSGDSRESVLKCHPASLVMATE